jgi:hypothetical protein
MHPPNRTRTVSASAERPWRWALLQAVWGPVHKWREDRHFWNGAA